MRLSKGKLTSPMLNKGVIRFIVRKYRLKVSPHPSRSATPSPSREGYLNVHPAMGILIFLINNNLNLFSPLSAKESL